MKRRSTAGPKSSTKAAIDEKRLAFYMGYAFSHAIQVQHLLAPGELTVPYVVYWDNETPTPVPYPAATQHEAVANAQSAREQAVSGSGWSSGREGTITQGNGAKMDVLVIEGWVPGLDVPLEVFVYYRKDPFRLFQGFLWKAPCAGAQRWPILHGGIQARNSGPTVWRAMPGSRGQRRARSVRELIVAHILAPLPFQ